MPLVFFVSPVDPRMLKTIDAIMRSRRDGGLLSGDAGIVEARRRLPNGETFGWIDVHR